MVALESFEDREDSHGVHSFLLKCEADTSQNLLDRLTIGFDSIELKGRIIKELLKAILGSQVNAKVRDPLPAVGRTSSHGH